MCLPPPFPFCLYKAALRSQWHLSPRHRPTVSTLSQPSHQLTLMCHTMSGPGKSVNLTGASTQCPPTCPGKHTIRTPRHGGPREKLRKNLENSQGTPKSTMPLGSNGSVPTQEKVCLPRLSRKLCSQILICLHVVAPCQMRTDSLVERHDSSGRKRSSYIQSDRWRILR